MGTQKGHRDLTDLLSSGAAAHKGLENAQGSKRGDKISMAPHPQNPSGPQDLCSPARRGKSSSKFTHCPPKTSKMRDKRQLRAAPSPKPALGTEPEFLGGVKGRCQVGKMGWAGISHPNHLLQLLLGPTRAALSTWRAPREGHWQLPSLSSKPFQDLFSQALLSMDEFLPQGA